MTTQVAPMIPQSSCGEDPHQPQPTKSTTTTTMTEPQQQQHKVVVTNTNNSSMESAPATPQKPTAPLQRQQSEGATPTTASPQMPTGVPQLHPKQMDFLFRLQTQIEFYFSSENLAKDAYLLGFLNHPRRLGMVPVEIICRFPRVREICGVSHGIMADPQLVAIALTPSPSLQVTHDGRWIVLRNPQPILQAAAVLPTSTPNAKFHPVSPPPPNAGSMPPTTPTKPHRVTSASQTKAQQRGASDISTSFTEATAPLTICGESTGSSVQSSLSPVSSESELSTLLDKAVSEEVGATAGDKVNRERPSAQQPKPFVLLFSQVPLYKSPEDKLLLASEVSSLFDDILEKDQARPSHIRLGERPGTWVALFGKEEDRAEALAAFTKKQQIFVRGKKVEVERWDCSVVPPGTPPRLLTPVNAPIIRYPDPRDSSAAASVPSAPPVVVSPHHPHHHHHHHHQFHHHQQMHHPHHIHHHMASPASTLPGVVDVLQSLYPFPSSPLTATPHVVHPVSIGYAGRRSSVDHVGMPMPPSMSPTTPPTMPGRVALNHRAVSEGILQYRPSNHHEYDQLVIIDDEDDENEKAAAKPVWNNNRKKKKKSTNSNKHVTRKPKAPTPPPQLNNEQDFPTLSSRSTSPVAPPSPVNYARLVRSSTTS